MATTSNQKKSLDVWRLLSWGILLIYVVFLIYPLANLLKGAFTTVEGKFTLDWFKEFFASSYYITSLKNSFSVSTMTTILALVLGYPMAYFYNFYDIKGKKLVQIIIILSSMSAPFVGAYAWIQMLGRNGIITTFLRETIGFNSMPTIYGFNGILLVLTLQLISLVFLYISGALRNIDNSLLEASESMGITGLQRFFKIIVPLTMPTILAAGLLVFMRAFSDFGTPLLIGEGYRTFTVEIYRKFLGETGTNYNFAATVAVIAIIITSAIFLLQKYVSRYYSFTMNALNTIERKPAKGLKGFLMHLYIYGILFLSYLPQILVVYQSFRNTSGKIFVSGYSLRNYEVALQRMGNSIPNTFISGISALIITVLLAVFISYLVVRRSNFLNDSIDTISMIPFIIPGSVVGIGLVMSFNKPPLVLTGTFTIMVIALVIRRISYTVRSSVAALQQIPMSIEEAAISLGSSKLKTFFKITLPMMSTGVIAGAILSWITIITELSSSILLYNNKTITMTLAIYTFVSRGNYGYASALATLLSVLTIISLFIYMKVTDSDEITL